MLNTKPIRLIVSLLFGLAAWTLIIYKALMIPVTHDEVATMVHYYKFSIWEIMMYPDPWPNNHILNTLLAKASISVFGQEQWAGRLPNVLSFAAYLFAAYKINKTLFKYDNLLFLSGLALFIFNPFLLDFFSLCRGYGLSNALLLCSAMFCLDAYLKRREASIWLSFAFAILASYANFTQLIYWCAINGMIFIYFFNNYLQTREIRPLLGKAAIIAGIDLTYLALIYTPIHKMQSTNQFVYWTANGFFQDTIVSLMDNTRYGSRMIDIPTEYFAVLAVMICFAAGAFAMYYWGRHSWQKLIKTPVFTAFLLLAFTVFVNIMQTIILKTPNLTTRTALGFYPLFILLLCSMIFHLQKERLALSRMIAGILLIFSIWHLARTVSFDRVREWWYDTNTFQVLNIIKSENPSKEQIVLQTNWAFHPSFYFYSATGKTPWLTLGDYNKEIISETNADYYYVFDSDYQTLEPRFKIIQKFDGGSRLLLKRKE